MATDERTILFCTKLDFVRAQCSGQKYAYSGTLVIPKNGLAQTRVLENQMAWKTERETEAGVTSHGIAWYEHFVGPCECSGSVGIWSQFACAWVVEAS